MRRREFITLLGGTAAAWPVAARAQQSDRMRRLGLLVGFSEGDAEGQAIVAAFRQRLRELGWTEGRNIRIELRWAAADPDKDGTLSKTEYLAVVEQRFNAAGPDKDGTVDRKELRSRSGRALLRLIR